MTPTDRLLRWLSWLLLTAGCALSVWLNSVHAHRVGDTVGFHVAIPLLVLCFGVYAEAIFMSTHPRVVRWLTGLTVTGGFGFAIAVSYVSILAVVRWDMRSSPGWIQSGTAGLPDVVMLIAVTVLLSHRWRVSRSRDGQGTVTDRPVTSFARLRDAAVRRAEHALTVPDRPVPVPVPDRPVPVPAVNDPVPVPVPVPVPETVRDRPVPDRVNDRHLSEARELLGRTGKRTPVANVAAVLSALDDGTPVAAIAAELGMGERTVRELRDARRPHLVGRVG